MLSNINIATYLTNKLNEIGKEYDEEFKIHNGAGHIEGEDARKINGILKQVGENYVNSKMNYININGQYEVEMVVSVMSGFSRGEDVTEIVNKVIKALNGVPISIAEGRAIFSFRIPKSGDLDVRAGEGNSVVVRFNFVIEYSEYDDNETIYEMALIDNHFCGSINTRYFESQEEQHKWYLDKINNGGIPFTKTFTPNINSLLITKQTYINELGLDTNSILSKNYAVIRSLNKDGKPLYYYYYEVQNADIGANNQVVFDLKQDTLQTYYFDSNIKFSDCFISKACLNRFVKDGTGFRFNTLENSPLFERESIQNVEKRLIKRDVVSLVKTYQTALDNWYKNNVLGWIYLYINGRHVYNMAESNNSSASARYAFSGLKYTSYTSKDNGYYDSMYNTLPCLCVPVYKTSNTIKMRNGSIVLNFDKSAIDSFINKNSADNIYAIKFSIVPPFDISTIGASGWAIEDNDLIISATNTTISSYIYISDDDKIQTVNIFKPTNGFSGVYGVRAESDYSNAYFYVSQQMNITISINYDYGQNAFFTKEDIVGSDKNVKFNPKLYNSDYMSLKISDNTQNGADYDILKLGVDGIIQLRYTEALTPDITKKYIRVFKNNDYCIYKTEASENLTGFVNSDDSSLIIETDPYKSMLANNKNFFLQNSVNRGFDIAQGVMGVVGSAAQGFIASGGQPAGAAVGAVMSLAGTGMNYAKSKITENLTVDNLKNAPNSINE
ncbi:MAG: hypothetical protein ACI4PF_06710, partial [Christensenellales bacterium]